tara:strand:- start:2773 stop:3057 length:285 start_codon:yes stop_codon:yes gene_type:complete
MNKHIDDTRYTQWEDGMYVMLDDLECDYEEAVVENSLRGSKYLVKQIYFRRDENEDCIGVDKKCAGLWWEEDLLTKLTRAQALYIATGETQCTK